MEKPFGGKIDIPQIAVSPYAVDIPWSLLEQSLVHYMKDYKLDLEPEFQRRHVWTPEQQVSFLEWCLRGGLNYSGRDLYFNSPGFNSCRGGQMVLVDGLQRMTAVLRFLRGEIGVLGFYAKDYKPFGFELNFRFHIASIIKPRDVLQWYLDFNSAGTVHKREELDRVKKMMLEMK